MSSAVWRYPVLFNQWKGQMSRTPIVCGSTCAGCVCTMSLMRWGCCGAGMSATKKWKTTLRVERPGGRSISLGAHLEVNGIGCATCPVLIYAHSLAGIQELIMKCLACL